MNRDAVVYAHVGLVKRTEASKWAENEANKRKYKLPNQDRTYNDANAASDGQQYFLHVFLLSFCCDIIIAIHCFLFENY